MVFLWYTFQPDDMLLNFYAHLILPVSRNMVFDNSHVALLMLIKGPPVMDRISIEVSNLC